MAKDILVLVDDLFFSTKITSTAKACGTQVQVVKNRAVLMEKLAEGTTGLVVIDLNGAATQPLDAIRDIKASPELNGVPVLAFLSHVQTDLMKEAEAAGADRVLPRSAFSQNLAQILTAGSQ